jgi:hypothetical protein
VAETGVGKISFDCFHPLVGENLTTGVTEASFAGMGNDNILVRVLRAGIFVITQAVGIAAREHLLYRADHMLGKGIFVPR